MPDGSAIPDVVVVGAAARDLTTQDARGWRLGGGVTYGALALARLGLRTGVVIGLDAHALDATELALLDAAGASVVRVPLARGPVFHNEERPSGRVQRCLETSDPIPVDALPGAWQEAPAWLLAPVAAEVPDAWAARPSPDACVAFGWQGILRHLAAGELVHAIEPGPSPLLARADLVGVSRYDLPRQGAMAAIGGWLGPAGDLLLTAGPGGGLLLRFRAGALIGGLRYRSAPSRAEVDPTGAGDTMLAGVFAGMVAGRSGSDRRASGGRALRLGAVAASLLVERPGLESVPTRGAVRARERELRD